MISSNPSIYPDSQPGNKTSALLRSLDADCCGEDRETCNPLGLFFVPGDSIIDVQALIGSPVFVSLCLLKGDLMIEVGRTYRMTYGNGSQLFHVVRISSKGKPFGYRLFGGCDWRIASLKIDDPRIIAEWWSRNSMNGTPLPAVPVPPSEKINLKPLKDAMVGPRADFQAHDKAHWDAWESSRKRGDNLEEWEASIKEGNRLRHIYGDLRRELADAKVLNTLVPMKSDLKKRNFQAPGEDGCQDLSDALGKLL